MTVMAPIHHLLLVRHAQAEGQSPDAPLTTTGVRQAQELCDFLAANEITRIVSSTYKRAQDSILPLSQRLAIPVELDERLVESDLSAAILPDWQVKLESTFLDFDLVYPGGESSRDATTRAMSVLNSMVSENGTTVVVSHGRLMALMLKHFAPHYGFNEWRALTNPDVFSIELYADNTSSLRRLWHS